MAALVVNAFLEQGSAKGIVAFVCGADIDMEKLQLEAQQTLPPWSVPQRILWRENFPLNPNGKIDRNALQKSLQAE